MLSSNAPTKLPVPFASSGTKNTIPVASQIGITAGAASWTDGFPPLTFTPIAAGGVPPFGADFNGVYNAITQAIRWANSGGSYVFDVSFAAAVGGYPKGALLQKADLSGFWLNTTESNTTNPDTGGAGWVDPLTGRLLRTLVYTNVGGVQMVSVNGATPVSAGAGSWVPSANMTFAVCDVQGAGGGGGGVSNPTAGTVGLGAPGSSGSFGESIFTAAQAGASQVITVGTGGAGGTGATNGATGGSSSIGSLLSAPGGVGGTFINSVSTPYLLGLLTGTTAAATGANVYAYTGRSGGPSIAMAVSIVGSYGGQGGGTIFGTPTSFVAANTNGANATTYGSGGSGISILSGSGPASGGNGAAGIVTIKEFA